MKKFRIYVISEMMIEGMNSAESTSWEQASLSLSPYVEDDDWEYEQCWINIVGASLSLPLPPSLNIDQ